MKFVYFVHRMLLRCLILNYFFITTTVLVIFGGVTSEDKLKFSTQEFQDNVKANIKKWAPLVWLAPDEDFFPSSVESFLESVQPWSPNNPAIILETLPVGPMSQSWFLSTKLPVETLLANKSSIIYGIQAKNKKISAPMYAMLTFCENSTYHHITYWMFFPYNRGKDVCMVNLGKLGPWPLLKINGYCLGSMQEFGSHVGDWEHMSIFYKDENTPALMYISAHEAGAYYKYRPESKMFTFHRQEIRNSGNVNPDLAALQQPEFPKHVHLVSGTHPQLFAAKGSHGLWAEPGQHKFVRLPRLYDESGFGTPWETWNSIIQLGIHYPEWMKYLGRWGNPKTDCHPLVKNICHQNNGPFGIPINKHHFKCS